jgi:hypothetical protein
MGLAGFRAIKSVIVRVGQLVRNSYINKMSNRDKNRRMLNPLKSKSNAELIMELEGRGFEVSALKEEMQKRELKASTVLSIDAIRGQSGRK